MVQERRFGWGIAPAVLAVMVLGVLVASWLWLEGEDTQAVVLRARVLLAVLGGVALLLALAFARTLPGLMSRQAKLVRQLTELARVDGLTGVANRRVWDEELARGLERARRTGKPCSVGLVDLDHFKRFNDTNGHQRGDALLRSSAQAFASRMRNDDLIARYGGEEFALLLHGCNLKDAERLFARLQGMLPGGQTFSAGITTSEGREEAHVVVGRADAALYRAKARGRNCTVAVPAEDLRPAA